MKPYAITEKQRATLDRFTCRRLSEMTQGEVKAILKDFSSEKGNDLVMTLKNRGWYRDNKGTITYYLVQDPDGQPVFFFSIRCGLLCDPGYVSRIRRLVDENLWMGKAMDFKHTDPEAEAFLRAERIRLGEAEFENRMDDLNDLRVEKLGILKDVKEDRRNLPDQNILWVDETHAAVELVEMCINDNARESWKKWELGTGRMGTTLFWYFMIGKVLELSRIVGCEYAYFFAAGRREGSLVKYYHNTLHFIEPKNLGTMKPSYDKNCVLMCKKLFQYKIGEPGPQGLLERDPDPRGVQEHRAAYFDNFNAPA